MFSRKIGCFLQNFLSIPDLPKKNSLFTIINVAKKFPAATKTFSIATTGATLIALSLNNAYAAQITLAWDETENENLGGYLLHYGEESGEYEHDIDVGPETQYTIEDLTEGQTYYIAVQAYDKDQEEYSDLSDEILAEIPDDMDTDTDATASSESSGKSLAAADIPPESPPIEIGEVFANQEWVKISFQQSFEEPVVVAPSFSYTNAEPGVVRIRNITSDGFEISLQSWESPDKEYPEEQVHFMVMEKGHYTLPNGANIEAGIIELEDVSSFHTIEFMESFSDSPVVLTSAISGNDSPALTTRKQKIDTEGFELLLQGYEIENAESEKVGYIAAEPSSGTAGSIPFEIGRTENVIDHYFREILFLNAYNSAPLVLLDMQTTHGPEIANVRWDERTSGSIKAKINETQIRDEETNHIDESVGYIVFGIEE